jgi:glyoxylase-like metal-dependent hydrolase (beta-lactamase superfamily II)
VARRLSQRETDAPHEIAPGVRCLEVGRGLMRSNVCFVRSGPSWALIDSGSATCEPAIQGGAEFLFGEDSPPAAILLTHDHPDHAGAARELAKSWRYSFWVHPDELPLVLGDVSTSHRESIPRVVLGPT